MKDTYRYNSIGFGTSQRKSTSAANTVGPGQYASLDVSKIGRNDITLKSRHGDSMVNSQNVPGPGQYNTEVRPQSGSIFPKGERKDLGSGSKTPGPGHVTVPSSWDTKETRGGWLKLDPSKERGNVTSKENVPGPGAYSVG